MKKILIVLLFITFSTTLFASPARFGGFSYVKDKYGRVILNEESETFNEGPLQLEEEPQMPYYLDEEDLPSSSKDKYKLIYTIEDVYKELEQQQKKTSVNYTPQEEKYKTPPVYSVKKLYEQKKSSSTKNTKKDSDDEDEDENEEEEE